MAEIPALGAARSFALRTDARIVREQQEQARARLEALRQSGADTRGREAAEIEAARRRRLQTLRDDLRLQDQNRRFLKAQELARADDLAGQRALLRQRQIAEEGLNARDLRVVNQRPPLTPSEPVGSPRTPAEIAAERLLQRPDAGPGLAPADTAAERPPPGPDAASGLAQADSAAVPREPDQSRPPDFQVFEQERDQRLAERREAERDAAIRQRLDLQLAGDRIDTTPPGRDLPRGSIVDLFG